MANYYNFWVNGKKEIVRAADTKELGSMDGCALRLHPHIKRITTIEMRNEQYRIYQDTNTNEFLCY